MTNENGIESLTLNQSILFYPTDTLSYALLRASEELKVERKGKDREGRIHAHATMLQSKVRLQYREHVLDFDFENYPIRSPPPPAPF